MFGIVVLTLVGVILITVLFLVGTVLSVGSSPKEKQDRGGGGYSEIFRRPVFASQNDFADNTLRRTQPAPPARPITPVQNNHYRPATPVLAPSPATIHHSQTAGSDHSKMFRQYQELSADERDGIVDLNQCIIDVERSRLDPLLNLINGGGDGRSSVEYVVCYFNKKIDKQLTPSERFIRKSFKIKNRQTGTSRFARLKISNVNPVYYRLTFHDYTPYVEQHSPKYDVFDHAIAKERSHWEQVEVARGFGFNRQTGYRSVTPRSSWNHRRSCSGKFAKDSRPVHTVERFGTPVHFSQKGTVDTADGHISKYKIYVRFHDVRLCHRLDGESTYDPVRGR
ncbi:hypothetical protein J6590_104048 [Homalodisca vitripennis]|nr:hypothetical protein J6590_104048 [Homalodisca vitripennis]